MRNAESKGRFVPQADLKARTRAFALAVIGLVEGLPQGRTAEVIGRQVEEEADETQFWLDLVVERGLGDAERVSSLREEARQLVAIAVSSIRTARRTPSAIPHSAFRIPH